MHVERPFLNLARYCLAKNSQDNGSKTALVFLSGIDTPALEFTYSEIEAGALKFGSYLQNQGLQKGDRVFIKLKTSPQFVTSFFGAMVAGFIPVPLSALLTTQEVLKYANIAQPKILIVEPDDDLQTGLFDEKIITSDQFDSILTKACPAQYADTRSEGAAFMVFTSGTSAEPKAVVHAHRVVLGRKPMFEGWSDITPRDRVLHAGALNWTYSLGVGLLDVFCSSATAVFYTNTPDPALWVDIIEQSGATIFAAVPSLYRRLLKYGDASKLRNSSLRHGLSAGEPLSNQLFSSWQEATGLTLYEALGMSEISTYISSSPRVVPKPGSPGKPQKGRRVVILSEEVAKANGEATEIQQGGVGLIAIHHSDPGLLLGYFQQGEIIPPDLLDGWFVSGDLACLDEDGYIWFEGRGDEIMNASGYRVSPIEVESVLSRAKSVAEIAVCEFKIEESLSLITAFVVLADGAQESDAVEEIKALSLDLALYKRPRSFKFVPSLPRTPNGKLKRMEIVARFAE